MLTSFNKNIFVRIVCIAVLSLIIGIVVNQIHPRGIPLRLLIFSFKANSVQKGWQPISTDSSFVHYLQGSAHFFDIRPREQYRLDHIKNAQSLPFYEFINSPKAFNLPEKKSVIILYDFNPLSSKAPIMIQQLKSMGYKHIFFLRNGYSEWLEYDFPTKKGDGR
ncbi:MAG: rhodanese-like domain-containing protein [bacterium]